LVFKCVSYFCLTDINECLNATCQNGATCVDGVNTFTCTCAAGFTGTLCETGSCRFRLWFRYCAMLFARKLATGIIFFDRLIRLTISPYLVRSLALEVIFLCFIDHSVVSFCTSLVVQLWVKIVQTIT
jgi:EGF-like domain